MNKIILGSQSPRRKELLELANIPFDVLVANVDETIPQTITTLQAAGYLAQIKNNAIWNVLEESSNHIVITADTIVVVDNEILGKPNDDIEAYNMLKQLSGKKHQVITGVCIASHDKTIVQQSYVDVYFHELSQQEIKHYIQNYKTSDKAGAYAIQEWVGAIGIEKIEGDYYSVMGLPIAWVYQTLKNKFGYNAIR